MASNEQKPRVRATSDGLQNVVTALGTDRDKRSHNRFAYESFWDWQQMESAYQTSWLARQVVDAPVDDATREWREIQHPEANKIEREEKRVRLSSVLQEGFKWSRLYGGSIILLITGQPLDQPLEKSRIKKGDLKRMVVIDRFYVSGFDYNYTDPLAPNYLLPEYYTVYGGQARIHYSHVVRVPGEKLPLRLKQQNAGWDDSTLRKCIEDLKDAISTKGGIASLIQEANVDVIKRDGLGAALTSGEDEAILARYRLFGLLKSTQQLGLLDENEEYQRHAASFGGLGDVLHTMMEWVSGAAQIPMTRLFGIQSKGMGDSGEGDTKNYNNSLRSIQDGPMREVLEQIDEVLVRSALGEYPDDYDFNWAPLSPPSGNEVAQQELAHTQADGLRLEQGVARMSEIMRLRQDDYGITDERIEEQERIEEMEGEEFGAEDPYAFGELDPSQSRVLGEQGEKAEEGQAGEGGETG